MRRSRDGLLVLLALLCAGYWFGNSGLGLGVLCWEARRRVRASSRAQTGVRGVAADTGWLDALADDRLAFAYVGRHRVVLIGESCGRREVFRDELSEREWVRLRRQCFSPQPATGRSTSI